MGDGLIRVAGKQSNDLPFGSGQSNRTPTANDLLVGQVNGEVIGLHHWLVIDAGAGVAEHGTQSRKHLVHAAGSGDVVARAGVERGDLTGLGCAG